MPDANSDKKPADGSFGWLRWAIPLLLVALLLASEAFTDRKPNAPTIDYSRFYSLVEGGKVEHITIEGQNVAGTLKAPEPIDGKSLKDFSTTIPAQQDRDLMPLLHRQQVDVRVEPEQTSFWGPMLVTLLPWVLVIGVWVWLARKARGTIGVGGPLQTILKGRPHRFERQDHVRVRFDDVAGLGNAKRDLEEVVEFLRTPERFQRLGGKLPRGVLMVGPPGTGKTLLARAVAGEAEVPFLALTGSSFVEMFVGVGAARVRDLFAAARKAAPSIIFIDEIDAIGQRRGGALVSNDEREQTLNQMLAEMDGFDPASGVVVLAATNRPETLDPALLRPGRFDRQVEIPLPNLRERAAILAVHARDKHLDPDVDLDVVARGTPGFSGADLANLVNEAAIVAVRADRTTITAGDFSEARDRILIGRREATNALLPEEKHAVAVHEAGHALVAALSPGADPVAKVTILPAGQALGVTQQLPVDERHLYGEHYLKDSLAIRLGGRAAELLVLGEASTGASNDLAGATDLAGKMVREFGMSARVGPVGFASGSPMYLGGEEVSRRPYAEETQRVIDEEVAALLREA